MGKKIVFIIILCCGLIFTGKGLFIFLKARIAQVMLEVSWANVVMNKKSIRPWPWADFMPVACLFLPNQNIRTIVVNSASGTSLAFAPGHLDGSAFPGTPGNCIIFGHRETHFHVLSDCEIGDEIQLSLRDGSVSGYKINRILIIDSDRVNGFGWTDESRLILITCYPFYTLKTGEKRYVVIAEKQLSETEP